MSEGQASHTRQRPSLKFSLEAKTTLPIVAQKSLVLC